MSSDTLVDQYSAMAYPELEDPTVTQGWNIVGIFSYCNVFLSGAAAIENKPLQKEDLTVKQCIER